MLAGGSLALRSGAQDAVPVAAAEPPADVDIDGDGVPDELDRCVALAGLSPDGCPPRDGDGDGVIDRADECPKQPGPRANRGCPDRDADSDGVVDRRDQCRDTPGVARFAGCRPPDGDGDGITDEDDRCPDSAEVWNGRRDSDGCRDRGKPLLVLERPRTAVVTGKLFKKSGALERRTRRALRVAAAYARAIGAHRARAVVERKLKKGKSSARRAARNIKKLAKELASALSEKRVSVPVQVEERAGEAERIIITFD